MFASTGPYSYIFLKTNIRTQRRSEEDPRNSAFPRSCAQGAGRDKEGGRGDNKSLILNDIPLTPFR